MRKSIKKKFSGKEKAEKEPQSAEADSNGSLISDDISEHESLKKDASEDDDRSEKNHGSGSEDGDSNDQSLAKVAKAKNLKKKASDQKDAKKSKQAASDSGNNSERSDGPDESDDNNETAATEKSKKATKKGSGNKKGKKKTKTTPQSETEFEVDKVVGVKETKGKKLYLIRWKGYNKDSDTWEPESDLSCPAKIQAYLDANPQKESEDEEEPTKKSGAKRKSTTKAKAGKVKRAKEESGSEEETKEYEVEKIIEVHHKKNGKREYLVRWKGYSSKEDTWEPEAHLECPDLISKFNAKVEKGKQLSGRELRVNPAHTEPYTLTMQSSKRRLSRRGDGKQRARYYEAE